MVHNELGGGWLWVTSQRTGESGIIVQDLVKPVVSIIMVNASYIVGGLLTRSLLKPGGPCIKSMGMSESRSERV